MAIEVMAFLVAVAMATYLTRATGGGGVYSDWQHGRVYCDRADLEVGS